MKQDPHEQAIRRIQTLLGGQVIPPTFKLYPDGYFDTPQQPRPVEAATAEPKHLKPLNLALNLEYILDWRNNHQNNQPRNCIHCHRPTPLHDDASRPAHKICTETALTQLLQKTA
jgi:hypothetical protein